MNFETFKTGDSNFSKTDTITFEEIIKYVVKLKHENRLVTKMPMSDNIIIRSILPINEISQRTI